MLFNIFLVNKIPQGSEHSMRFGPTVRYQIMHYLTDYFIRVCQGTSYEPKANWLPPTPRPNELVVYFVPDVNSGMIRLLGGRTLGLDPAGLTWRSPHGMVSEVFVTMAELSASSGHGFGEVIAKTAFHELMHNKLDADPDHQVVSDIHVLGGLAALRSQSYGILTDDNCNRMRNELSTQIVQCRI